MNAMRKALEEFLSNSTPEQLQAELNKGNRPFFQTLDDPVLLVAEPRFSLPATVSFFQGEFALPGLERGERVKINATVSFFQGEFVFGQSSEEVDTGAALSVTSAANQDLALAA